MITVKYKDTDITGKVSINRCWHDMYAEGQSDILTIRFNDTENQWDKWNPQTGDEIAVEYGSITTGKMFIDSANPENGLYKIVATSSPPSAKEPKSKAWQKINFTQIGAEIAAHHGLGFKSYGIDDVQYDYIMQTNKDDFAFLNRLCVLEGCAFLVFNGNLIMYSQTYMEGCPAVKTIDLSMDADYKYRDNSALQYSSCVFERGEFKGEFDSGNGCSRVYVPNIEMTVNSAAEANRYAKSLLRNENKNAITGFIRGRIMPELSAASTAQLVNARAPSWDGTIFLTHVRNDYGRGESKLFFRKPLGGY